MLGCGVDERDRGWERPSSRVDEYEFAVEWTGSSVCHLNSLRKVYLCHVRRSVRNHALAEQASHFRCSDVHWCYAWPGRLDCSSDVLEVYLRHLVVVVDVAHPERAAVVAGEEDLVRLRDPNWRLMGERECWVRCYCTDGRARAQDLQEFMMEYLEERRGGIRGVEELLCRGLPERTVYAENIELKRINKLWEQAQRMSIDVMSCIITA